MKLYAWTGFVSVEDGLIPDGAANAHVRQTAHWIVLKTDREFRERFGYGYAHFKDYVSVQSVKREPGNPGAQLAIENPGVLYVQDIWNHPHRDQTYVPLERR